MKVERAAPASGEQVRGVEPRRISSSAASARVDSGTWRRERPVFASSTTSPLEIVRRTDSTPAVRSMSRRFNT
jgi:hypothetical protein